VPGDADLLSPNRDARPGRPVDVLVLHYTGMRSAADALARLCDPAAKVSAHYLINEDGSTTCLVPEEERAWHAGVSRWRGQERLNDTSIGIEIVNPGHEFGYRAFTEMQYRALIPLARAILGRWPIPARNVVAHSDIAPGRKEDPGELFDWPRLAAAGIGLWPADGSGESRPVRELQAQLAEVGYGTPQHGELDPPTVLVIRAFQRRFRPEKVDGVADRPTLARLDGLLTVL
jgi:N-acetylmuramoyl-L-alanine amidase